MGEKYFRKHIPAHVDARFTPKERAMIDRIKKEKAKQPDRELAGCRPAGGAPGLNNKPKEHNMKNKAIDLHNILFEELERLNDLDGEEMKSEKLVNEFRRAETMCKVAAQLTSNRKLVLDAMKFSADSPEGKEGKELSEMFASRTLPAPKPGGEK